MEEKYPLGNSTLGSPLYQFLSKEVEVGRLGIALGDFLTHSESQRRKRDFPGIFHYWSGKATPWYPENEMTPPAPRGRTTNEAQARVTTGLEIYEREQEHTGTPKQRTLGGEGETLDELTARNTRLNSSPYVRSARVATFLSEDIRWAQGDCSSQQQGKDRGVHVAFNSEGGSPSPASRLWREVTMVGQPPKVLKSAMRKTSPYNPSIAPAAHSKDSKGQEASPPVLNLSSENTGKRHLHGVPFERPNKRRRIENRELLLSQPVNVPNSAQEKTTRYATLMGPIPETTTSMPMPPIREAPTVPRTGQARRASTIQTGLVPTLLMQASTLHTAPRKGFPMCEYELIDGDDSAEEALDVSPTDNRLNDLFRNPCDPTPLIDEQPRQILPTPAQAELSSPTSSPSKDGIDQGDDDYEKAFKEAWDEALMPPPPRPASRPTAPVQPKQSSQSLTKESNEVQELIVKPRGSPATTTENSQAKTLRINVSFIQQTSAASNGVEQPLAELGTEAVSDIESVPGSHVLPELPRTTRDINIEQLTEVGPSIQAPSSSGKKVRHRRQAKEPAQKRNLRMSTMAQRPEGVRKLRPRASRRTQQAWRGLKNDKTEAKMNEKGFLI